jgi:murein L,D-transpeptidase YcbB/YkuD
MKKAITIAGLAGFFAVVVASAAYATPSAEIQRRMEQLSLGEERTVAGVHLEADDLLPALYADRAFELLWTREDTVAQLQSLIDYAVSEGLDPIDYPIAALSGLQGKDPVGFDIVASEILIRVAYHLRFGKVNPQALDASWNFDRRLLANGNPPRTLQQAATAPSVTEFVAAFFPRGELYADVKTALADYRALEADGGWPTVPGGAVLQKGDEDPRVPALRARLSVTDGAPAAVGDPELFDDALQTAVIAFQGRHALDADGVVGDKTYAALNVPIASRIDQLRLTLERGRWIMEDLSGRFVLVNIAGFQAALVKDREFVWAAKVQVGKPYRATPVFKGEIEYMQVNPTWTVPPTILSKDTLPAIRKDPSYLEKKNMVVLRNDGTLSFFIILRSKHCLIAASARSRVDVFASRTLSS